MIVRVRGYLMFRDLVGRQQVEVDDGATLRKLLEKLAADLGEGFTRRVFDSQAGLQRAVAVLINGVPCARTQDGLEMRLHDGDEIAIFPPMAGG